MQIPARLAESFTESFSSALFSTLRDAKLLERVEDLTSPRFLARSVQPHVERLSTLFNRLTPLTPEEIDLNAAIEADTRSQHFKAPAKREKTTMKRIRMQKVDADAGLRNYWRTSPNRDNFLLSYVLGFMPGNAIRVGAAWSELDRVGFRFAESFKQAGKPIKAIEFGAGPASGAVGIGLGEAARGTPQFVDWDWALIEQDRAALQFGAKWLERAYTELGLTANVRPFHRKIDAGEDGFLPRNAPRFQLFLSSYFLNELAEDQSVVADKLMQAWDRHLEDEAIIVLVEPALKLQSRRLLSLRAELLRKFERDAARTRAPSPYHVITPCLGHQACGALAAPEDWCHEEVLWWRPPFLKQIDALCGLDRRTLPFSYLVIAKSPRSREELLPDLAKTTRHRLVSPTHSEGKDLEFYTCGEDMKRKVRFRPEGELGRGSLLLGAEIESSASEGGAPARVVNRPKVVL